MDQALPSARVLSLNVARPRSVDWRGRPTSSAIWKEPVDGPRRVEGVNIEGDDQADRRVHGGPDKAVYAYASEDYDWWARSLGPLAPGTFGENLTTVGIDLTASMLGDRWHVGTATLEVSQPRQPCFKLGMRMGDPNFVIRFLDAGRPGAYLRIIEPGELAAGAEIRVEPTTLPAISIADLASGRPSASVLERIVGDTRVAEGWRREAEWRLQR